MFNDITNKDLLHEFNRYVIGHERAKKDIITLVNRSLLRFRQKFLEGYVDDNLINSKKLLIPGLSGTGKTELINVAEKIFNVPFFVIDSTRVVSEGSGDSKDNIKTSKFYGLISAYAKEFMTNNKHYINSLEGTIARTIIVFDEFDKLSFKGQAHNEGWYKGTQYCLLRLIENNDKLQHNSIIFLGAFQELFKQEKKGNLGFFPSKEINNVNRTITPQNVIDCGILEEIIGRIDTITPLDVFSNVDYYNILIDKLIPEKFKELENFGYYNMESPSDTELWEMADHAVESNQGIRDLKRQINSYYLEHEFNYEFKEHKYERQLEDESVIEIQEEIPQFNYLDK